MSQKEHIIREATAMFFSEGIKSVRMDDIANRLGVSKRTLYEMFGDKKALLVDCIRYYADEKHRAMMNDAERAANVMEEIFAMLSHMKRDEMGAAFVGNIRKFHPDIYRRMEEEAHEFSYSQLDKMFDRGMTEGLFIADMNKKLALMTLVYTMGALFENKYEFSRFAGISGREAFDYVIVNFFRGLSTEKGIKLIDELVIKYRNGQL